MVRRLSPLLALLLAVSPSLARAQPPVPATLDASARKEVVAGFAQAMRERYVFADVGDRVAKAVTAALDNGQYDAITDPADLAAQLSAAAATIAHDKHLRVDSLTAPPPRQPAGMTPPPRSEAGVVRADKLEGGVGYIEISGFPPKQFSKPVFDRAMAMLAGSRAVIIDIRGNHGGDPEAVSYLVSFFIAPDQAINDILTRTPNTTSYTRQSYRSVGTPISLKDVPIFVLTSHETFSGGEEFAYDLQALKRATLIGETTGGGANPVGPVPLGHGIVAGVPFGRAENPITKTNWEGRGVQPQIIVRGKDALRVALERAGVKGVADIETASLQRVFSPRTTPRAGSETALRHLVEGIASGNPDYAVMAPQLVPMIRDQLAELRAQITSLGALRSVTFLGPDMIGGDEYRLTFDHGVRRMALVVRADGKMILAASQIAPDA